MHVCASRKVRVRCLRHETRRGVLCSFPGWMGGRVVMMIMHHDNVMSSHVLGLVTELVGGSVVWDTSWMACAASGRFIWFIWFNMFSRFSGFNDLRQHLKRHLRSMASVA